MGRPLSRISATTHVERKFREIEEKEQARERGRGGATPRARERARQEWDNSLPLRVNWQACARGSEQPRR
eukprot:6210423-Pleurochrysis_carterae.AAC.1